MKKATTNIKKLRKKQQKEHREQVNMIFEEVLDELFDERPRKKKKKCNKCCESCANFTPIGEGDHICIANDPVLILDDYCPTENYFYCGGENYESWDDI